MTFKSSEYLLLMERIDEALNTIRGFICSRSCCYDSDMCRKGFHNAHSYVNFSKHIWDGEKFSEEEIKMYESNVKHGVIHGVCTYIAACLIQPLISQFIQKEIQENNIDTLQKKYKISNSPLEMYNFTDEFFKDQAKLSSWCYDNPSKNQKILVSCLVHDFCKSIFGHDNHGPMLKKYFPRLDPITYDHTNPTDAQSNEILIKADRLELFRYNDYESWLDEKLVTANYSDSNFKLIKLFYEKVRPVLEKAYRYKDQRWIRHGIEHYINKYEFKKYYPSQFVDNFFPSELHNFKLSLSKKNNNELWSIELSKGPINDCFSSNKYTEGKVFPWEIIQGKIPLDDFNNIKGTGVVAHKTRDHYFAYGNVELNKWVFNHKPINSHQIQILLNQSIRLCSEKVTKDFIRTCDKIIDAFYSAKLRL
jgi:hypothetical protein